MNYLIKELLYILPFEFETFHTTTKITTLQKIFLYF